MGTFGKVPKPSKLSGRMRLHPQGETWKILCLLSSQKKGWKKRTKSGKRLGTPLDPREVKDKSRESFFAYFLFKERKGRKGRSWKNIWESR